MPWRHSIDLEDDTEGHMGRRFDEQDEQGTPVTVWDAAGTEVSGHLRRDGGNLILEAPGEESVLPENVELTIRLEDGTELRGRATGGDVQGHKRA